MEEYGRQILCFTDVCGQGKAKRLVSRAISSGRIPHAYLFKGPGGVGKRLFARGVAAALNCRGDRPGQSCGSCISCLKFLSGNHPDFLVVSPEKGTIKIDRIRQMCKALSYPPYESDFRVVLIEDVHSLRQEAANSLLKTLEEPPTGNVLILTAEASKEILTTISSRCQVIPFFGLSEEDTVRIICEQDRELDQDTARLLARLAEGSPGQALLLHKMEMVDTLRRVIGIVSDPAIDAGRDAGVLLQAAEEMAALKEDLLALLGLLRLWLRDHLLGGDVPAAELQLSVPAQEDGRKLKSWSSDQLFAKLRAVDRAEKELARNCNRTLVCEVLLFHLY